MASSIRRVAVIAGAAQGIGRAIAERLAKDGLDLGLFDLPQSKELMEELANSLRSEFGTKVVTVYGNVAVESDVQALVDTVVQELGELYAVRVTSRRYRIALTELSDHRKCGDGVLLRATRECVHFSMPFYHDSSPMRLSTAPTDVLEKSLDVNVKGVFFCYKYAAIQLIKQGKGGRLIAAASTAGKIGMRYVHHLVTRWSNAFPHRRLSGARGVQRDEVCCPRPDAVCCNGLRQVWHHSECVRPRGLRYDPRRVIVRSQPCFDD